MADPIQGDCEASMIDREDPEAFYRFPEPFYRESLPCENCGRPAAMRQWNAELQLSIGVDCPCVTEPDEPVCVMLTGPIMAARSVREIVEACKAHRNNCPLCNPQQSKETPRKPYSMEAAAEPRRTAHPRIEEKVA